MKIFHQKEVLGKIKIVLKILIFCVSLKIQGKICIIKIKKKFFQHQKLTCN